MGNTRAANRRTPSPKAAVTRLDNLLHYTIDITNNHKRFPKSVRYTITDQLINELLEANGHARVAARNEPYNKVSYKAFKKNLQKAIDHLTKFESLMIIANMMSYNRGSVIGYQSSATTAWSTVLAIEPATVLPAPPFSTRTTKA